MTRNLHETIDSFLQEWPTPRKLRQAIPRAGGQVEIGGRMLLDFASNDYLGLSRDPVLIEAAENRASEFGTGATASRLITGNHPEYATIEAKIANLKGSPAALLMNSGFVANCTVLAALLDWRLHGGRWGTQPVRVFADRLVHASIHFGIQAAGIRPARFHHNDLSHLDRLLRQSGTEDVCRMIVTESVFSMEGDQANVAALRQLADDYDAMLYVDEAHATGVLGPGGAGLAATVLSGPELDRRATREITVGTFGKALGSIGAYVSCDETLREYLVNRCSGMVYATALPPMVLGAIDAALDRLPNLDNRREHLQAIARHFRDRMRAAEIDTLNSCTHIVPVAIGNDDATMRAAAELMDSGFMVAAIRPPTVPPGTSRLRISFSASHKLAHVDSLADAIIQVLSCQTIA